MAVIVNITLEQFAKYTDDLAKNFMPTALRGIRAGALRAIPIVVRRTKQAPPASPHGTTGAFNTGLMAAGWRVENLPNGARLYNIRPYSGVVEAGRRAGKGIDKEGMRNLKMWTQRKLGLSGAEAESAAFAIMRTMKKRPLWARNIVKDGLEEISIAMLDEIEHELMRALGAV